MTATESGRPLAIPESAISGERFALTGNRLYTLTIDPEKITGGVASPSVRFSLTPKSSAANMADKLYAIIDLTTKSNVTYVTRAELLNGKYGNYEASFAWVGTTILTNVLIWTDVTNDVYKTDCLVLRHIPATTDSEWSDSNGGKTTFGMGCRTNNPAADPCQNLPRSTFREVTLSEDYWIGVFEITQKQWYLMTGKWPSAFSAEAYREMRPVESVSYWSIRASGGWPTNTSVGVDGFLGKLHAWTGCLLDLPTEAQWEFAGRAGTLYSFNDGRRVSGTFNRNSPTVLADLDVLGRYAGNGGTLPSGITASTATPTNGTAIVGSYRPNAWGLYDIHGNVSEFCLNWWLNNPLDDPSALLDPKGPETSNEREFKGGNWTSIPYFTTVTQLSGAVPTWYGNTCGFRVAMKGGSK